MDSAPAVSLASTGLTGLKCRYCRCTLFSDANAFAVHDPTTKKSHIKYKWAKSGEFCSHYYLDQDAVLAKGLTWLSSQIHDDRSDGPVTWHAHLQTLLISLLDCLRKVPAQTRLVHLERCTMRLWGVAGTGHCPYQKQSRPRLRILTADNKEHYIEH